MPKIQAPANMMTVQEAARRLIHEGLARSGADSVAVTLRNACKDGLLDYRSVPIGRGKRMAKLVFYEDARRFWLS